MVHPLDLFGHETITIHPPELGAYGTRPGSGVTITGCAISAKHRLVRDRDGNEVVSSTRVAAPADTRVEPGWYVTLPDTTTPVRVIAVATASAPPRLPDAPVYVAIDLE